MLSGDRVVLRPFRPSDVEPLWLARLDPLTWARTREAPLVPATLAELQTRYAAASTGTGAQSAVDVEGVLAGRAGLLSVDDLARSGGVGLTLLPEHRGHGVLRVLLRYAFRSRDLRRVHLPGVASTERALRAHRAVGLVEEGRLREHGGVEDGDDDVVLMAVLRVGRQD